MTTSNNEPTPNATPETGLGAASTTTTSTDPKRRAARGRRGLFVGAIAAPLALVAAGLSLAQTANVPLTPVAPSPIAALAESGAIAAKGEVAEIFGNKFVLQDESGRALVDTGREGEGGKLVAKGETVTVQGKFEKGALTARLLTHGDGRVVRLGPSGAPAGSLDWARDKIGLGPTPDVPKLTKAVQEAGYSDVRVAGQGPRHLEVAAKDAEGRERMLHVGFDGKVRDKPAPHAKP